MAASIINVLSDFFVVLIPIPVVAKLQLRTKQRIIVISLFATGFAVCIVGIVRAALAVIAVQPDKWDILWDEYSAFMAGAVELYVGLVSHEFSYKRSGASDVMVGTSRRQSVYKAQ